MSPISTVMMLLMELVEMLSKGRDGSVKDRRRRWRRCWSKHKVESAVAMSNKRDLHYVSLDLNSKKREAQSFNNSRVYHLVVIITAI